MEGQTEITNQPMQLQEMDPKHDFSKYFDSVLQDIVKFFESDIKWYEKTPLLQKLFGLSKYFEKTNLIIEEYVPIWKIQKSYSKGKICLHVYKMLYLLINDTDFKNLNKYDQNVLLWATLLHDISKRGKPIIKANKDPIHPFKSAWQVLHYFNETFKFIDLSKEDLEEWDMIFSEAYITKENGKEIQNHKIVPNVKQFLDKKLKGKEFEKEVILYVMLHQSVPTLCEHPHSALLEPLEEEVPKYFNKRTFGLFRILLRNDSFSYLMYDFRNRNKKYGNQIDENVNKLIKFLKD